MQSRILAAALSACLALGAAGTADGARTGAHLSLVAYSTPAAAFAKIIPAFQATSAGRGVSFDQSYGAAETQVRAIVAGLPADVVDFALEPNVTDLVAAKLVSPSWNRNAYHGVVSRSVVVFVVRDGNPKHIRTWDDLVEPGVQVVTPNPFTSGGARWNVLAAYGAMLRAKRTPKQAVAYLRTLFRDHVVSQDTSARNALQTFLAGKGDVLLTYENEAILAKQQGQPVFYLAPKATIMIENVAAVLATSKEKAAANAFLRYLWTPAAQRIFAEAGYRPVVPAVDRAYRGRYPIPKQLFKIGYVGGWAKATRQFFDPRTGIMTKIEQGVGVSTGG